MSFLGTVDLHYADDKGVRTGFTLIDEHTIAMSGSDLFGVVETEVRLACCDPSSIVGVVAYDAARDIALVKIDPPVAQSISIPTRPMPAYDDQMMKISLTLPMRFEVGPAFIDMDTHVAQVAEWAGIGEVLIFESDRSLVMNGSLVIDAEGYPVALLCGWGGGERKIGTPLSYVIAMQRHEPIPLELFVPEKLPADQHEFAFLRRGQSLRTRSDLQRSLSDIDASLRSNPENWLALYERGVLADLMNTGLTQSERSFEQCIEIEDEWSEAHYSLGLVRYKMNKHTLAEQSLLRSIELDDSNPDAYSMLGLNSLELGSSDQAFDYMLAACERAPDAFMYLDNLSSIAAETGRDEEVLDRFVRFVEDHPRDSEARDELGRLALRLRRASLALEQFAWLAERSPNDPDILARLAFCQMVTGDTSGARDTLNRVEAVAPDHELLADLRERLGG